MQDDWTGDLNDNCYLERHGMRAHVEQLDKHVWWFAIDGPNGCIHNVADNDTPVRLTTGKMARAAAESCIEMMHQMSPNIE